MARILGLPVTEGRLTPSGASPRADQMRTQLGGRAATTQRVGELVQLRTSALVSLPGVLLAEADGSALVLTRGSVVRRAPLDRVEATQPAELPNPSGDSAAATPDAPGAQADPDAELAAMSRTVRRFAALREGQRVQVRDSKLGLLDGILVEKCRFGGLVLKSDDSLVAVGFGKLEPHALEQQLERHSETPAGQGEQAD